uniref:Uncharacterized protein n=1 Tax=mine drainage metagenome TaxID=410659 RepID=E6QLM5_9ZZZZ
MLSPILLGDVEGEVNVVSLIALGADAGYLDDIGTGSGGALRESSAAGESKRAKGERGEQTEREKTEATPARAPEKQAEESCDR